MVEKFKNTDVWKYALPSFQVSEEANEGYRLKKTYEYPLSTRRKETALLHAQSSVLGKTNIIGPVSRVGIRPTCSAGLRTVHLHLHLKIKKTSLFMT